VTQAQQRLPLLCTCEEKSQLIESESGVACPNCGQMFSTSNGVYDLEPGKEYYWNEFTPEEMRKLLDLGWAEGWDAMATATAKAVPVMGELLRSNARLDSIFHCYSPDHAQTCLDVGCGWGTNTEILSHLYEEVWSMDGVSERLEATRIRLEDKGIENVRLVRNFLPRMPFADNTFDMVVIKGVLEWIPLATTEHPTETQRNFLAEVYRVLKPGGCLLLGIENRFGAQYLMGVPDHTGLHLTSYLPRRLADLAVRWNQRRKTDDHVISHDSTTAYRPYTYTKAGYHKILGEAGFNETDIYWAKSYQTPRYSAPVSAANVRFFLDTTTGKFRRFQGTISSAKALFRVIPPGLIETGMTTFTPNFLICSYKGERPQTMQDQLLSTLDKDQTWIKIGGSDAEQGRIQYFILDKANPVPKRIIAFARYPESTAALATEYDCLNRFSGITAEMHQIGPKAPITSEPTTGKPTNGRIAWSSPYIESIETNDAHAVRRGLDWLEEWQQKTKIADRSLAEFAAHVSDIFAQVQAQKADTEESGGADWGSITQIVTGALAGLPPHSVIAECAEHRDFAMSNVRYARSSTLPISGRTDSSGNDQPFVIDWDLYSESGWPFADAINYLLSYYASSYHQDRFRQTLSNPEFGEMLDYWAQKLDVPSELVWYMIPYQIARLVIDSRNDGLLYRAQAEPLATIWLNAHQQRALHQTDLSGTAQHSPELQ